MLRIRKRMILVVLVAAGQFVCLMLAVGWFTAMMEHRLAKSMRQQVLADNQQIADQMAMFIEQMNISKIEFGSKSWQKLQSIVESIQLPNEGFICVIENHNGKLICHPEMQQNPGMRNMTPGMAMLRTDAGELPVLQASADADQSTAGWAVMPDGTHLIAARRLPDLNVTVMAHQRERGVVAASARVVDLARSAGWTVVTLLTLFTLAVTAAIVHRYENRLLAINEGLEDTIHRRSEELLRTRNAVIFGLAKLAESRDDDTGRHLDRIRKYVEILGHELGKKYPTLDDFIVSTLGLTSSLHDIGKVGIPDAVLQKPGKLTDAERAIIQKHTLIGGDCLIAIRQRLGEDDFLDLACEIAFAHHERWDGKGYPFGLAGDNIPLSARIVAVADVYDALRSQRAYKEAMPHEKARDIIVEGSGTQFDPEIVEAFLACDDAFRQVDAHVSQTDDAQPPVATPPDADAAEVDTTESETSIDSVAAETPSEQADDQPAAETPAEEPIATA